MDELVEIDRVELDVVVKMLKMAYSFESWDKLVELSDSLFKRVVSIYESGSNSRKSTNERPLVYYYGYSLLMKGLAYKELEKYEEAKKCIEQYSDLSWFKDLDKEGLEEVKYYSYISVPNHCEIMLLSGDDTILDQYVSFLLKNPKEILPGIVSIVKAANNYNLDIDHVLDTFSGNISNFEKNMFQGIVNIAYYHSFLLGIIKYKINKSDFNSAIEYTLQLLASSDKMENDRIYKQAVIYFESLRKYAKPSQVNFFDLHITTIMERVEIQ